MFRVATTVLVVFVAVLGGSHFSFINHSVSFGQTNYNTEDNTGFEKKNDPTKYDILFTGDVMLARKVEVYMNNEGLDYPFRRLPEMKNSATYMVGNFEASVPKVYVPTPYFTFAFSVPEKNLQALKDFGFTHLSLANNHTYDYGEAGLANTILALKNFDIEPFGRPNHISYHTTSILNLKDVNIGLIGIHALFSTPQKSVLKEAINLLKEETNLTIAYIHWGDEYILTNNNNQSSLADTLIELGIDMIVGHHPHVVQNVEIRSQVPIFYSLGNFIFDQYFSRHVQEGLLLGVSLKADSWEIELIPVTSIDKQTSPRLMLSDEKDVFLRELAERSDESASKQISSGLLTIPIKSLQN